MSTRSHSDYGTPASTLLLLLFIIFIVVPELGAQQRKLKSATPLTAREVTKLSRGYQKSAIIALTALRAWQKAGEDLGETVHFRGDKTLVLRTVADRESETRMKAEEAVKLAQLDVSTDADKSLQKNLRAYYETVRTICDARLGGTYGLLTPDVFDFVARCPIVIEKSIDDGSIGPITTEPEACDAN